MQGEREEQPEVLSIGSIVGGVAAASRAWNESISRLATRVAEARVGVESPLNLNVVFHVPGEVVQPDGEYVRTGRFDRRTRHLMVQVTVPEALPEDVDTFLLERLSEAVAEAEAWAKRRGVADELRSVRELVHELR